MEQVKQVGDWRFVRVLGRGSFGIVALWKNLTNGQQAAIKQFEVRNMPPRGTSERILNELKDRWKKEVDMMYNLVESPFVVSTLPLPQCFMTDTLLSQLQSPLLCLEYCTGGDLRQMLKRPENIAGLPEKEVRNFLDHMGQAISYLHERNIIHRDIKPENILLQHIPSAGTGSLSRLQTCFKLGDLGFAKDLSDSLSLCSTVVGTLQYLAPEIYMGKRYDKTVDYWSFALIAFEVACGMRPFLHGESPSQWIPYVEEKERDVISIYRTEEDAVKFAKTIPYDTHLTEMFKQCLEQWLKIMLQLDPSKRGCKISSTLSTTPARDGTPNEQNLYGLSSLPIMLRHKRLEILSPLKRLGFVIGRSTTILDIQNSLSRHLALTVENQLILTTDGNLIQSNELAAKFTDSVDLYLIPKILCWYRLKIKLPRIVHNFLQTWESFKDPLSLRKVWGSSIYYMQSELEKLDTLKKMSNALRMWIANTVTPELKSIKNQIEKSFCSLTNILELEDKLQEIDDSFGFECKLERENDPKCVKSDSANEILGLETYYKESMDDCPNNLVMKPVRTSELEEIYHKNLKYYDDWRSAESNSGIIEHLLRGLCQFVAQRDPVFDAITNNIVIQLKHVEVQQKCICKLQNVSSKVESVMFEIMKIRCEKQKYLLETVFGQVNCKELPEPKAITMQPKTPEPVHAVSARMSKSDATSTGETIANLTEPARTLSLDGTNRDRKISVVDLMQESQILQFETEDTLSNAQKILQRLLKEADDWDWEFI